MFTDAQAGRRIFERWRERFGDVDAGEEIYIGLIRKLVSAERAHYGIFLTSNPTADVGPATFASRTHHLRPVDDVNLSRFLADVSRRGGYLLMSVGPAPKATWAASPGSKCSRQVVSGGRWLRVSATRRHTVE